MHETLEKILEILRGLWRFRWLAFACAAGVCLLGWTVVLMLPNVYEANARVFVDPSTALKPVIEGIAIEQDINAELNLVRQTLLGQQHLKKIIDATGGLGGKAVTPEQRAAQIDQLHNRIAITIESGQPSTDDAQGPSRVYTLSYRDSNRDRSLKVVQILLDSLVTGTLGGKRQGSIEAQKFIMGQIADYEKRLTHAEEQLAVFKKRYVGMVPGTQTADYFTQLQNEMDAVKKAQSDLNIAITRRNALNQQLRGEAPIAAANGGPMIPGATGQGGDTLSRIKETQARLEDLLLRYTDNHPDVLALQETLVQLKQRREAEIAALRRGDAGAAAATGASANPVYQSIQLALNQANVEIAGLRGQWTAHQEKVDSLRRLVDTMPQVEAQYARLNRDYTVTKEQYTALVERLGQARLGEEAEAIGSVRFEVINPPAASFSPVFPQRSLFLLAVLVAAIGGGLGVAYLLHMIKPVFNNAEALTAVTGINVLGVVSAVRTPAELALRRRGYLTYSLACSLLLVGLVLAVIVGRKFSPLGLGG